MNTIRTVITTIWNTIKSTVTSVLNAIRNAVSSVFNRIVSAVRSAMGNVLGAVRTGFSNVKGFITGLAGQAYTWGRDLIMGIVRGIQSCISAVSNAVCNVANTIRRVIHFSVPDEGPLTYYESWMPDFMKGLAAGIEKSKGMVARAMDGVASDMVLNPNVSVEQMNEGYTGTANAEGSSELIAAITSAMQNVKGDSGDLVIPVYLGGTLLDEVIISAQQRANLRSGGR
jgi:phage-related protein|nr:MAG TPA: tail tape measure protein [Caudoviricetes sp.]